MSLFKPAGPHNPVQPPGICLCVDCCRIMAACRCPARDGQGRQCGTYRHRGNEHSLLVDTTFQIVDERLFGSSVVSGGRTPDTQSAGRVVGGVDAAAHPTNHTDAGVGAR